MSKSVSAQKESGAHQLPKGHDKPAHQHGPVETGKHEKPAKAEGLHRTGKPIVHVEDTTHHSGRPHPPAIKLVDSKILGGKLRLSDQ